MALSTAKRIFIGINATSTTLYTTVFLCLYIYAVWECFQIIWLCSYLLASAVIIFVVSAVNIVFWVFLSCYTSLPEYEYFHGNFRTSDHGYHKLYQDEEESIDAHRNKDRKRWILFTFKLLSIIAAIILLLLVLGFVIFIGLVKFYSIPKLYGELKLAGLTGGNVTLQREINGITHVIANNDHDLFFGQGVVHAQDRLWQMEVRKLFRISNYFN